VTTAAPAATGVATASAEGTATSLARSDHAHQANTAPANVTKAAAAIGTSGEPARADHKHDVTTGTPVAVGTANAEGSATSLARSDHVHDGPAFGKDFVQVSVDGESTYTGTVNYQVKATLNTPAGLPAGTYRIGWYVEFRNQSSIADDVRMRVREGAATDLCLINVEFKDQTNYIPASGFMYRALTGGPYAYTLEYSLENAADTVAIRRARLEFWRVS
jgi:hypothetical protein